MPDDKLTHAQRQKVYGNLAGYDVDDQIVKLSKVNLFLHGFPDPAIHIYDTLRNDARWHEKADLILANPPFMTPKSGVTPHTKFRIGAKKAEVLFTDYIVEHLSAGGRGGVIVPNGIVATTQNAYVKLRRFLVEDSLVAGFGTDIMAQTDFPYREFIPPAGQPGNEINRYVYEMAFMSDRKRWEKSPVSPTEKK